MGIERVERVPRDNARELVVVDTTESSLPSKVLTQSLAY